MKKSISIFILLFITNLIFAISPVTISVSTTPGNLSADIQNAGADLKTVINLTVTGNIDSRDFTTMRDSMLVLKTIDLSTVTIDAYSGTGGSNYNYASYSYAANAIPGYAFVTATSGKESLTSIIFPESLLEIESLAFSSCTGLTSISIPATVNIIQAYAFMYCTGLSSVSAQSTTPINLDLSMHVFYDVDKNNCVLHVPSTSLAAYQSANQWMDFFTISNDITTKQKEVSISNIKVFTNKNTVIIKDVTAGEYIELFNMQGTSLYKKKSFSNISHINLTDRGIYIIKVGSFSEKIMY